jgi:hypothetical protein
VLNDVHGQAIFVSSETVKNKTDKKESFDAGLVISQNIKILTSHSRVVNQCDAGQKL